MEDVSICSRYVWSTLFSERTAERIRPPGQVHLGVSGRLEISPPPEGGECTALVLPRWHYPDGGIAPDRPALGSSMSPQVEVVDILDASGRVMCHGALVAPDWVLTAGACLEVAFEVQWGPQRMGVIEAVEGGGGGAETVALLRLEHAVCSNSVDLRMDDDSNIGAGPPPLIRLSALPSTANPLGMCGQLAPSICGHDHIESCSSPQHVEIAWHDWQGGAARCSSRWSRLPPRRAPPLLLPAGTKA